MRTILLFIGAIFRTVRVSLRAYRDFERAIQISKQIIPSSNDQRRVRKFLVTDPRARALLSRIEAVNRQIDETDDYIIKHSALLYQSSLMLELSDLVLKEVPQFPRRK